MKRSFRSGFRILLLVFPFLSSAQSPLQLLQDVLPGAGSSDPRAYVALNGQVYFIVQRDAGYHLAIWATDGTPGGTHAVFSIPDSVSYQYKSLIVKGDSLFFITNKGASSTLWRSDGTTAGTMPVLTFDYFNQAMRDFTVFQNRIWFAGNGGICAFSPGLDSVQSVYPRNPALLSNSGNFLYWFEIQALNPYLSKVYRYRADGQSGLTDSLGLAGDQYSGSQSSAACYFSLEKHGENVLQSTQNIEYDAANNPWPQGGVVRAEGYGATGGNHVVSAALCDSFLICYSNQVLSPFFDPVEHRVSVVRSNGVQTAWEANWAGSTMLAVGGRVFVQLHNALWVTDGTEAGTAPVKEFGDDVTFRPLLPYGDQLLFWTKENNTNAVWLSDGTAAGTVKIVTLPYLCPFDITNPPVVENCRLIFTYKTPATGNELWAITLPPCMPAVSAVEISPENGCTIAPNPAAGRASVTFDPPSSAACRMLLSDLSGRIRWQAQIVENTSTVDLPTDRLETGLYFISIEKEGRSRRWTRVVVQR